MTPADALLVEAAELRARAEAAEAEARRLQAQEREDAIVAALDLYGGELWTRAKALAVDLKSYAANGWRRELRSRGGEPIGDRQMFNIAKLKSGAVAISTGDM